MLTCSGSKRSTFQRYGQNVASPICKQPKDSEFEIIQVMRMMMMMTKKYNNHKVEMNLNDLVTDAS